MKKKADGGIRQLFANHFRNQHEMVVVDPDNVSCLISRHYSVCKQLIDTTIMFPGTFFESLWLWIVGKLVMKWLPQNLLAKLVVMSLHFRVRHKNRN